jgi:hypothetical protein
MKINFFEEFPTKTNLQKLKLITWSPCVVFLACNSLQDFQGYKNLAKKYNPLIEAAWWPMLKSSIWISPWSNPTELAKISKELASYQEKIKVLIDLEPPVMNKILFLKNSVYFCKNKKRIKALVEQKRGENVVIYTAELPPKNDWQNYALEKLGLTYPQAKNPNLKRILMLYSSMPLFRPQMKVKAKEMKREDIKIGAGLGVIAKGTFGNEPLLSAKDLFEDLNWCKKAGFNEATIFRLGGLNQRYLEVIKKFV